MEDVNAGENERVIRFLVKRRITGYTPCRTRWVLRRQSTKRRFSKPPLHFRGGERTAYLDAACGEDLAVRARIERQLGSHEADGFMQAPAPEQSSGIEEELARLKPEEGGEHIGPYPPHHPRCRSRRGPPRSCAACCPRPPLRDGKRICDGHRAPPRQRAGARASTQPTLSIPAIRAV